MTSIASLGIEIDSRQARTAAGDLDKLDKRNVTRLVDSYPAAAREIWSAYFGALMGVR